MLPMQGVLAQVFNPSTQGAQAGRSLGVPGQPGLRSKLLTSQRYVVRPVEHLLIQANGLSFMGFYTKIIK